MNWLITPAYAAICNNVLPIGVGCNPDAAGTTLGNIISAIVGFALVAGTIAALIFFIVGALRWIISSGDKNKLQAAQEEITHAIIGLIILAAAWAIFILVSQFLTFGTAEPGGGFTLPIPKLEEQSNSCISQALGTCIINTKSCSDLSGYESAPGSFSEGICCRHK